MLPRRLTGVLVLAVAAAVSARAAPVRVAQAGTAFVESDDASGVWTLGTGEVRFSLAVSRSSELALAGFSRAGGGSLIRAGDPDSRVGLDAGTSAIGGSGGEFVVERVSAAEESAAVRLDVRLRHRENPLAATRHYRAYSGTAAVETWTSFEATAQEPMRVGDLNAFVLVLPNTAVEWTSGLDVPAEQGGSFAPHRTSLADGQRFSIGGDTIATQAALPVVSLQVGDDRLIAALAWSGAWSASFDRSGDELQVAMGLPPMSAIARPGEVVEGPHGILAAVPNQPGAVQAAITSYLLASRQGRGYPALTAFNTWFVRGIAIDAENMTRDIELADSIGLELFQLDAGWYASRSPSSVFDFTSGLGSWEVDRERFPEGLGPIGDLARALGMQFGVWVEPERVDLGTVGRGGGADERFLAKQAGRYNGSVPDEEAVDGQICLGHAASRAWVWSKLTAFLDDSRPDYLKWDFNRWVTCTRSDHDHPADGGNFAHVRGLYALLEEVRRRYPRLLIENCSGGGHRLDLELARLTDAGWMDDRSAPSAHVRSNLRGLAQVMPSSYLFSYVMPHADEPMSGDADIGLMVRSRLPAVFGVAANLGALEEGVLRRLEQGVALAKTLRGIQAASVTHQLVLQDGWDVIEQVSGQGAVVFAFEDDVDRGIRVPLRGLEPGRDYEIRSFDFGVRGTASGAELMRAGVEILPSPVSGAQLFTLLPVAGATRR